MISIYFVIICKLMKYKDFEYDFVERTLTNLEWIKTQSLKEKQINDKSADSNLFFPFTNMVNQSLGLIVLIKQFSDEKFVKTLPQEVEYYHLTKDDIEGIVEEERMLYLTLTHLRNSIAHGRVKQSDDHNDEITEVVFWDAEPWRLKNQGKDMTFENAEVKIFLTFEKLQHFAITIANEYLKKKQNK